MGKTPEDTGRQTATSSLASDNDVKSEAAASDMTSYSLRKKKNRRGKICGRWHRVSPYRPSPNPYPLRPVPVPMARVWYIGWKTRDSKSRLFGFIYCTQVMRINLRNVDYKMPKRADSIYSRQRNNGEGKDARKSAWSTKYAPEEKTSG